MYLRLLSIIILLSVCGFQAIAQPQAHTILPFASTFYKNIEDAKKAVKGNTRLKTEIRSQEYSALTYRYYYPEGNCWNDRTRACEYTRVEQTYTDKVLNQSWPGPRDTRHFNLAGELVEQTNEAYDRTTQKYKLVSVMKTQHSTYSSIFTYENATYGGRKDTTIDRHDYTYDAQGDVTSDRSYRWNKATRNWDTSGLSLYTILSGGLPSTTYYFSWSKKDGWQLMYHKGSTYNNGKLVEVIEDSRYDGPAHDPYKSHTYLVYDAAGRNTHDIYLSWNFDSQLWDTAAVLDYHYNTNNDIDTVIGYSAQKGTGIRDSMLTAVTYNSLHLPLNMTNFIKPYGNSNWEPTPITCTSYEYEQFDQGVGGLSTRNSKVTVYPNPARSILNIDIILNKGIPVSMAIFRSDGRMIDRWEMPSTPVAYKEQKDISGLSSGTYYLKVQAGEEAEVTTFGVVR